MTTVTVLHPGSMGAAVAAQAVRAGHRILWVSAGRSQATRQRAEDAGMIPCASLQEALDASDAVLAVCPPQAADEVAVAVARHRFDGIYIEANAISPQRAEHIASDIRPGLVLDGAIIGPPPTTQRTCRLYLAGDEQAIALTRSLFKGTSVEVRGAGAQIGSASALKAAFAGFQKAARTLAGVSHALADAHGVADLLTKEAMTMPSDILSDPGYLPSVAARAWRWAPEMLEIADTLRHAGLPTDLAEATAAVMTCWEKDKNQYDLPVADVLTHLRRHG